jgi:solute carrier family 13 (sodium-dependent dicarboxylate transporter), member 2/3/5
VAVASRYISAMPLSPEALTLAPILLLVIVLWVTEALPLAVTALLGAVLCVVAGVAPAKEVFRPFADPLIFLFIGSFLLAEAIRMHGLDRRLAYRVLSVPWIGERPARILAAVALVSVLISAFISNTVTAAMMMAIVTGILGAVEAAAAGHGRSPAPTFATSLFLCVAFAASIGGLATPIGTPTNLIGLAFIRDQVGVHVSFLGWCAIAIPLVAVMTTVAVTVLSRLFPAGVERLEGVGSYVVAERSRLGRWTTGQKSVAAAFAITVFLWVLPGFLLILLGASHPVCGWLSKRLPEGVVALIGAILLFLLPGNHDADGRPRRALEWREARIDWDIVLLYGGGMALGELCFSTGLAGAIGQSITGWIPVGDWSGTVLVALATVVAVVTSEFTSNTASANMVVPVVIALARATGVDPLMAALAATFASSLGFMMPVSTPCNAIVYGSGRVPLRSMMASGAIIDVVGAITVTAAMLLASRL